MDNDENKNRDERGRYVNDAGVTIKVSEYDGGLKIDFYDNNPELEHRSIHAKINNDGTYKAADNVNGEIERSEGKCYLTTACIKHCKDKFDDNCNELTILRYFRDKFVSSEDIEHYYAIAPIIVNLLDNIDNDKIYNYIYTNVILSCVDAINRGDYDFAYNRYKINVLALEKKLVKKIKM